MPPFSSFSFLLFPSRLNGEKQVDLKERGKIVELTNLYIDLTARFWFASGRRTNSLTPIVLRPHTRFYRGIKTGPSFFPVNHLNKNLLAVLWILALAAFASAGIASAQTDWKKDWDRTVENAKKEGQVTIYMFGYWRALAAFEMEFPGIKLTYATGGGSNLGARIMAERRAGKYIVDLFSGGANTNFNVLHKANALDPLRPALLLPEVLDESLWLGGKLPFTDPDDRYIFAFIANPSSAQLYYNTKLFNPTALKSFWDLLESKWKGKFTSLEPTNTSLGGAMQFLYRNPDLGPDFIRRFFSTMDVTFSGDSRQMTDWLAQGKFALCMGCRDVEQAKNQGLPVDVLDTSSWKEGTALSVSGGTLGLLKSAPHPNAAKVFINWFLSRKGQTALQTLGDPNEPPNSRRIDIPKEMVAPNNKLIEGRRYLDVTRPEWQDMAPIFKLARDIIGSRK
jgi:iron(III) transport system substrate-binding protein